MGLYDQYLSLATPVNGKTEDRMISRETFKRCLGTIGTTKNIIIDRMFQFYDQDSDGSISFPEMVRGMSVLCKGSLSEKIYREYLF